MKFKLAKVFTSELLNMQNNPYDPPAIDGNPQVAQVFRVHQLQRQMNCCGFHTALDYRMWVEAW